MDTGEIIEEIRQFIQTNILAPDIKLEADTSLPNAGIDSFSTVEIILFLERQYGLAVPDSKLVPDNFRTLRALAGLVQELKG